MQRYNELKYQWKFINCSTTRIFRFLLTNNFSKNRLIDIYILVQEKKYHQEKIKVVNPDYLFNLNKEKHSAVFSEGCTVVDLKMS